MTTERETRTTSPAEGPQRDPDFPEGAAELPNAGAPSEDPYTPEPGPRAGERRAFGALAWAWVVALVVAAIVVLAVLR
jgi:hypothetical protein